MIEINKQNDSITPSLNRMLKELDQLPAKAHKYFVSVTPIDTGNARNRTKLVSKDTILANYPYARRLDRGYSKQAPQGMTKPTEVFIDREMRKIIRK